GVGFALSHPELGDIFLNVTLIVIAMLGIIELLAARRLKVVDPGQAVRIDEIGVEAKSDDDQIFRRPADSPAEILEVLAHLLGDVQSARIMIAAYQQHTAPSRSFMLGEAPHHCRARIEVAPALEIGQWGVKLLAHRLE